nr:uncharacterized protein LOC109182360 isoform X4 [Ipomoea batatas]
MVELGDVEELMSLPLEKMDGIKLYQGTAAEPTCGDVENFLVRRPVKSNVDICNDIREFLSMAGLPQDHVPTTKELTQHGRIEGIRLIHFSFSFSSNICLRTMLIFFRNSISSEMKKVEYWAEQLWLLKEDEGGKRWQKRIVS